MRTKQKKQKMLSEQEKRKIVEEYLNCDISQSIINQKYSINGHSSILKWIRRYGYQPLYEIKKAEIMKQPVDDKALLIAENQELKRRLKDLDNKQKNSKAEQEIDDLKKRLHFAEMSAYTFNKMIEIAERNFGIEIKKKSGTKQ